MNQNLANQEKLNEISMRKSTLLSNLNSIDMSLRGFLLVDNEAFITTYTGAKNEYGPTMKFLESNLTSSILYLLI